MAFEDLDWASDANYPAGSESWSATPTRVAPSAGQQAAGVAPEDVLPAQWFNWLFGNIVEAGQALESRGLQEAWDRAEADGVTTPHLSVGTDDLVVGTDGVPGLFKVNGNTNQVEVDGTLTAVSGAFSSTLSVGGGPVQYGTWSLTPAFDVAGTSASSADIGDNSATYLRIGNVVSWALSMELDSTGYTASSYVFRFTPPVSSDFTSVHDVQGTCLVTDGTEHSQLAGASANIANNVIDITFTLTGSPATTLIVRANGHYVVA